MLFLVVVKMTETKSKRTKKKKRKDVQKNSVEEENDEQKQEEVINPMQDVDGLFRRRALQIPKEEPSKQKWEFWDTQPVPKLDEKVDDIGKIEQDKEEVKENPYSLPPGFEWDNMDLKKESDLEEVYKLLNENYVEDEDNMFRFDYSPHFLKWALLPPEYYTDWHCGVRVSKNKKLVGFISAVPAKIKVYDNIERMVEINFLCVHKKLRSKRVAPVLIREITRRVNARGIFQAVYTAGVLLPKPIATCRYYHRSLNPKKLVEVEFSHLGRNQTMQRLIKLMKMPDTTSTPGLRLLTKADVSQCHILFQKYMMQFNLAPYFSEEQFSHFFIPREGVVQTYVVENPDGKITDMASFFALPSSIMHHPLHKMLNAAYSFYVVSTETEITKLMKDILIIARQENYDVFNALDLMENQKYIKELKFGMGDGNLNYYLFNYKCPNIDSDKIGLVLQ